MPPLILIAALLEGLSLTLIQGYLPLYVRRAIGEPSYFTVALVVAAPAAGTVIASNFWGGLSDVSGRLRPVILVGLLGYALALGLIPSVHQGFEIPLVAGAASLLYGTLAPSLKTYVTLRRPDRKEFSIAFVLMAYSAGSLIGSVGAGNLLQHGIGEGMRLALGTACALMTIHTIVCAFALPDQRRDPLPAAEHPNWIAKLRADLASLYENPALLRLCALAFLCVAGNYIVWGFFSLFLVEHLGASIRTLQITLVASAVLGTISFLYVGHLVRRFGGRAILATGVTLYVVMYAGIATARQPIVVAAFFTLPLFSMVNVGANTLASELSTVSQRGGGLGVLNGTYALATIAGPVSAGLLADRFGLGAVPWLALGLVSIAAPIAWVQVVSSHKRVIGAT